MSTRSRLVGPVLLGVLIDATGRPRFAFVLVDAFYVLSALVVIVLA